MNGFILKINTLW